MSDTYTVAALAERYGVSVDTVRRWIGSGELGAVCVSADKASKRPKYVVTAAALAAFEAAREAGQSKPRRTPRRRVRVPPGTIRLVGGY